MPYQKDMIVFVSLEEKDGFVYFHYFCVDDLYRKVGMPKFVKIDATGHCQEIENKQERMWALTKEVRLHKDSK